MTIICLNHVSLFGSFIQELLNERYKLAYYSYSSYALKSRTKVSSALPVFIDTCNPVVTGSSVLEGGA